MTGERVVRRLAAILAADVVGYSRLMGRDENGTLGRLREHRQQRLEPVLARHGGRLVKLTGDGALFLAWAGSSRAGLRPASGGSRPNGDCLGNCISPLAPQPSAARVLPSEESS